MDRRSKARAGTGNGMHKLKDDDVRAIRTDTRPQWMTAYEHQISASVVSAIKHHKLWGHVK